MDPNHGAERISLAKALSVKNRLAGRLAQAQSNIQKYNSVLLSQGEVSAPGTARPAAQEVDIRSEFERLIALQDAVVTVKAAIQRANAPVYEEVLRMAECKALAKLLEELDTKQGPQFNYQGTENHYAATITRTEAQQRIRALESEVDRLQDRLNAYNATTVIELPVSVLDLAR